MQSNASVSAFGPYMSLILLTGIPQLSISPVDFFQELLFGEFNYYHIQVMLLAHCRTFLGHITHHISLV
jgi:hypothetical protein